MPVVSLAEDKPKIVFHAAMMAIQNFGFFTMYWDIFHKMPDTGEYEELSVCSGTKFAVGFMAMICFCEAFLCVGMGFGGYTDDKITFALFWLLHLVGGGCYTLCTILIPVNHYGDDGKECSKELVDIDALDVVYPMHAALYFVYVGGMLSITYFSFVKPTFLGKSKVVAMDTK